MPETGTLSRILPGQSSSVPFARSETRGFLGNAPRTDDAELIVSELATNAVRHSLSREADGQFELRLEARPGWLRIEVVDQGPPHRPGSAAAAVVEKQAGALDDRESGRGLEIVDALADKWGHEQRPEQALWWAELWTEER